MLLFSGDGERLDMKPSWPLRVVIVIDWDRESWRRILFVVVPSARRDMEEREVIETSGALKGVDDTGCDEGERRSWVWRWPDREVEYAIEESVAWKMVDVKGVPCDGVNVAREDYIQLATI
jgi:hypothetical protein